MEQLGMGLVVLGMLAVKGAGLFAIVYVATRMAIRHDRRASR
jgi:hypothetical protein